MGQEIEKKPDGKTDAPKSGADGFDFKAFGKLPVRFNGRVANYDLIARIYLARVSGRSFYRDGKGQKRPAIQWLLDTVSGHERAETHPIIPVTAARLRALLKLADKVNPKRDEHRYSVKELRNGWRSKEFAKLVRDAKQKGDKQRNALEKSALELDKRFGYLQELAYSHIVVGEDDADRALSAVRIVNEIESRAVPRVLPGGESGRPWRTLLRGSIEALQHRIMKQPVDDPALFSFVKMLHAYTNNDAEAFNRELKAYEQLATRYKARRSPLNYQVPQGWIEEGVPAVNKRRLYGDTLAHGHSVVDLMRREAGGYARILINHFPEKTRPVAEVVNYWRMEQGLAPLPAKALNARLRSKMVAGMEAPFVNVATPKWHPARGERSISAIIQRGGHTWVVSIHGDVKLVDEQAPAFERFLGSIRLGSVERLAKWFDTERTDEPQRAEQYRLLAAMLQDGDRMWLLQMTGRPQAVENQHAAFDRFVRSVRVHAEDGVRLDNNLGLRWTAPGDWKAQPADEGTGTLIIRGGEGKMVVGIFVQVLGEAVKDSLPPLVNTFRRETNLPFVKDNALSDVTRRIEVAGRQVVLVDFTSPAPPKPVAFTKPTGWIEAPANPLQYAAFQAGDKERTVKVTVTKLPGRSDLTANVNRWRRQVGLGPEKEAEIRGATGKMMVGGVEGHYADLAGAPSADAPGQRILGVMVHRGKETWFFKMTGPAASVNEQKKAFEKFLTSVTFQ